MFFLLAAGSVGWCSVGGRRARLGVLFSHSVVPRTGEHRRGKGAVWERVVRSDHFFQKLGNFGLSLCYGALLTNYSGAGGGGVHRMAQRCRGFDFFPAPRRISNTQLHVVLIRRGGGGARGSSSMGSQKIQIFF